MRICRFVCACFYLLPVLFFPELSLSQDKDISQYLRLQRTNIEKSQSKTDWFFSGLAINYVVLNSLDLITTFASLGKGAKEINPVTRLFVRNKPAAVLFKAGVTGGILWALTKTKKHDKRAAYITLGFLNVLYGVVVANNIGVYLQIK